MGSLQELARIINIYVAACIPKNNITAIVLFHGGILRPLYTKALYKEKYKVDNPNVAAFNSMLANNVHFIVCGQAMQFFQVKKEQMLPFVKVALSARSELASFQAKGYMLKVIQTG